MVIRRRVRALEFVMFLVFCDMLSMVHFAFLLQGVVLGDVRFCWMLVSVLCLACGAVLANNIPENAVSYKMPRKNSFLFDFEDLLYQSCGSFNLRIISLTGFQAQSVRSSNADALDSPYLLVLISETSQSRQHESRKSLTAELFEVDSGRISIHHCEY
ncbi:hypothetical protein Tco_0527491 [Tanacetum coccineum]